MQRVVYIIGCWQPNTTSSPSRTTRPSRYHPSPILVPHLSSQFHSSSTPMPERCMPNLQPLHLLPQQINPKAPIRILDPVLPDRVLGNRPSRRPAPCPEPRLAPQKQTPQSEKEVRRPVPPSCRLNIPREIRYLFYPQPYQHPSRDWKGRGARKNSPLLPSVKTTRAGFSASLNAANMDERMRRRRTAP